MSSKQDKTQTSINPSNQIDTISIFLSYKKHTESIGLTHKAAEASSTIKVPILVMTCEKIVKHNLDLGHKLQRKIEHHSNGSGYLEWMPGDAFNIRKLIYYMMAYSDCVATNMLIDFIGGQKAINQWLDNRQLITRLLMPYIRFKSDEFEPVGKTSSEDLVKIYKRLDYMPLKPELRRLIDKATSRVDDSWLYWYSKQIPAKNIHCKTGSMIKCPPDGDTILNVTGHLDYFGKKIYFGLLSKATLSKNQSGKRLMNEVLDRLFYHINTFANQYDR